MESIKSRVSRTLSYAIGAKRLREVVYPRISQSRAVELLKDFDSCYPEMKKWRKQIEQIETGVEPVGEGLK